MKAMIQTVTVCLLSLSCSLFAAPPLPSQDPLVRVIDINVGETAQVTLCDGTRAQVKVLALKKSGIHSVLLYAKRPSPCP